jgi:Zn-finger nucleic acid-binding protein
MVCPSCNNQLTHFTFTGVSVQACEDGCGGYWLQREQINNICGPPGGGKKLLQIPPAAGVRIFRDVEHTCPRCQTTLLFKHFFNRELDIQVDQCAKCSGFWIESGKLNSLWNQGNANGLCPQVTDYFAEVYENCISTLDIGNPDIRESAQQIVKIFRWISPEEFILGKDVWWLVKRDT